MLYLQLTGAAAFALLRLAGWERERVSDALVLLTVDPRPAFCTRLDELAGETFEIWVGERRVRYAVYKDDAGDDQAVLVLDII